MSKAAGPGAAGVIVLTDIVEEGLPLDQLPDLSETLRLEDERIRAAGPSENHIPDVDLEVLELDLETSLPQNGEARDEGRSGITGDVPTAGPEGLSAAAEDEIAGDAGALLDDEEFAEIELPEDADPVLADLRNAGLRRIGAAGEAADCGPECETPDDYLVDETPPAGDDTAGERNAVEERPSAGAAAEAEISSSLAATIRRQVEAAVPGAASAEPQVCPEPTTPDFSRQIESLTQEWSKQLLHSTYASMDKMIQAVGDLAPTIVDRVAREIIPPLAEQVIKAEIARLEKKLEGEDDDAEDQAPPAVDRPGPGRDE